MKGIYYIYSKFIRTQSLAQKTPMMIYTPPRDFRSLNNNLTSLFSRNFFLCGWVSIFYQFPIYTQVQCRKNPALVYTFVECGAPKGATYPKGYDISTGYDFNCYPAKGRIITDKSP